VTLPLAALLLAACTAHAQPAEKPQAQVQFELGLGFLLNDDYAAAADTFERLYAATGSERVRLEWARALYLQRDYEQAETLFKAVLATGPPFPVREKIRYFLDDMSLAQGRLDYSVSLERDSNPRVIPSVRSFNIFGLPFEYQPQVDTSPKWGANYRLSGSKGLDDNRRWIVSAGVLGVHYGERALNKRGWDSHLTYRLQLEPRAEIKISHESMDTGGEALYRYSWATLLHVLETPSGWRWSNELRHGNINYPSYTYQNSRLSGYRIATEKSVSQFVALGAELAWDRGSAVEKPYSYTTLSHGLSGTYFMTSLASRLQLRWLSSSRKHAEMDPFFGVLREDKRSHIKLSLEPVNFRIAGMTPVIEVGYEKNESTLALINYKRSIAGITFRRSF
jgi:tetratricopeptide (TPR) repeat protein